MKKICLKEYDYLKSEITEVKTWINRYIGYVIGVSGISAILAKYLITPSKSEENISTEMILNPFTSILVLVALIIVTLLFEILWYKFKSHNKLAGYMQLLSQEIDHFELTEEIKSDSEKKHAKDPYKLKPSTVKNQTKEKIDINSVTNEKIDIKEDIITWEFFMSRLNDIADKNSVKESTRNICKATKDTFYAFKLPKNYDPKVFKDKNNSSDQSDHENEIYFQDLDSFFYSNCLIPIFLGEGANKISIWKTIKKNILIFFYIIYDIIVVICKIATFNFSLKSVKKKSQLIQNIIGIFKTNKKMRHINCSIDDKYLTYGWRYPIKLLKLAVISIFGLSLSFFYCLMNKYTFSLNIFELFNLGSLLALIWLAVIAVWLYKYVGNSHELINGKYSIEYYCWQFFIFRVQYLNEKNILPFYYSRDFIRFYKSYSIKIYLKKCLEKIDDTEKEDRELLMEHVESLTNCIKFKDKIFTNHKNILAKAKEFCKNPEGFEFS